MGLQGRDSQSFSIYRNHLEGLWKRSPLDSMHRPFDSVGLGQGLRICISNKLSDNANDAGLWVILWETLCHTAHIQALENGIRCPYEQKENFLKSPEQPILHQILSYCRRLEHLIIKICYIKKNLTSIINYIHKVLLLFPISGHWYF